MKYKTENKIEIEFKDEPKDKPEERKTPEELFDMKLLDDGTYQLNYCKDREITFAEVPANVSVLRYDGGFYGCEKLKSLVLHEGLRELGRSAFSGCSSLEYIVIPSTVEKIGADALSYISPSAKVILLNKKTKFARGFGGSVLYTDEREAELNIAPTVTVEFGKGKAEDYINEICSSTSNVSKDTSDLVEKSKVTNNFLEETQMSKLYKIARYVPMSHPMFSGALNGKKTYHGFEKAKAAMRQTVIEKFGPAVDGYIKKIDEYCQKYYPENTPPEIEKLKKLIADFFSDPAFPQTTEEIEQKYGWFFFEDDRIYIEFDLFDYDDGEGKTQALPFLRVTIYVDDKEIFIEGLIDCFIIADDYLWDDEDSVYRCWLSAGVYYGIDMEMTLVSENEDLDEELDNDIGDKFEVIIDDDFIADFEIDLDDLGINLDDLGIDLDEDIDEDIDNDLDDDFEIDLDDLDDDLDEE